MPSVYVPDDPAAVVMCGNRANRGVLQDRGEGRVDSRHDFSVHLSHRPVVLPSAYPVPTEYPKATYPITQDFDFRT